MNVIEVNIYGYGDEIFPVGCRNSRGNSGCHSCKKGNMCTNCNSKENQYQNIQQLCQNLRGFLKSTDISQKVAVNFIELGKRNAISDERASVQEVIGRGFNPPITVIDGIVRYYGGISNILVYKDVKELLS
ncbi:MAG: hypothetical protein LKE46_05875 [Clostridium sp.]|jgi:hypothetical protein|uniref:hypothetical protein n=1 Tax=Clostridium sp. TaxID=1506 RepID=UPI0025B9CC9F|nr:hypothetical protein [Clostridium sp.]MCH3963783.1 hypothetical protein [Clostridium sp.]MCI1714924.1 hypothetical protein [Clostridium sp.]MCI1798887.1 hypothetical protein [Clostridium sp.]MCI1813107.1 hypothetical protein [Clostridium sp.]MCI1869997.1 hypothetical protein [Clostridium sp.]